MIQIIVDSTSDMTQEEAKELGVKLLPIPVRFGEEEYLDGINLTKDEFYTKLIETDVFPKTSQITPFLYAQAMEEVVNQGDDALVITVSSKLSGCYQSAMAASEEFEEHVAVVDSLTATTGIQLLVFEALDLIKEGKTLQEVKDHLDTVKEKVCVIALLNTLEYLKKGGRISSTKATVGKVLGLKPVIAIQDGEVSALGTARGSKSGSNLLMNFTKENNIDLDKPVSLLYSGFSDAVLQKYIKDSATLYEGKDPSTFQITKLGCTIGSYAGSNAIGVAFFRK